MSLPIGRSGRGALEVATLAARQAGEILRGRFTGEKRVEHKGRGNIVTQVDLEVERRLVKLLREEYPDHSIMTEESQGFQGSSPYTWILDPLDGTRNYASGIPYFSVTVALARGDEVLVGIVHDPVRDELFWAEKGRGAFLNGSPMRVSGKETVKASVLGFDMGYNDEKARQALQMVTALWPGMQTMRVMGSAALGITYAACGRLDLYFHHSLYPWDLASGLLLVQEAGGLITESSGAPIHFSSKTAVAANPTLHADFMRLTAGMPWQV